MEKLDLAEIAGGALQEKAQAAIEEVEQPAVRGRMQQCRTSRTIWSMN